MRSPARPAGRRHPESCGTEVVQHVPQDTHAGSRFTGVQGPSQVNRDGGGEDTIDRISGILGHYPHCHVAVDIVDETPRVRKIAELLARGQEPAARRLLPPERPYPLPDSIARRIGATAARGRK